MSVLRYLSTERFIFQFQTRDSLSVFNIQRCQVLMNSDRITCDLMMESVSLKIFIQYTNNRYPSFGMILQKGEGCLYITSSDMPELFQKGIKT